MDHWSGNDEYAKAFPGLRIIATAQTRDYMSRMGPRFFADEVGLDRARARLDEAIRTGKLADGSPLTPEARKQKEAGIAEAAQFVAELEATPRRLPNLTYGGELTFWSGQREVRLISATGDATGSTVLYLPASRVLVTGDVLVSPQDGNGPPPWTTNSYAITPWLESLRRMEALDVTTIVPGQGKAFHDKEYLRLTIDLFAGVIDQVHAALERGVIGVDAVIAAVNVDSLGRRYQPNAPLNPNFKQWVAALARRVYQESLDGVAR